MPWGGVQIPVQVPVQPSGARRPPRQRDLPSLISPCAVSRATEIHGSRPAALHLEQIEAYLIFTPAHGQAQAGGRRFETMPLRAKQHAECTARLGRQFQTPQPAIISALQPEKYRGADPRSQ